MKLTISSNPRFTNKKKTTLKLAQGAVYASTEFGGQVIVPVSLLSCKGQDGKMRSPFVAVGQPRFTDRNNKSRVSYFSVHLDREGEENLEKLLDVDFLKGEAKRLSGSKKTADHEYKDDHWMHIGDREFTATDNAEDEEWMSKALSAANQLAEKSEEAAQAEAANASQATESAQTAAEALS